MGDFDPESTNNLLAHYNIYIVDQRGQLDPAKLSFDFRTVELKIERQIVSKQVSKLTRIKTIHQQTNYAEKITIFPIQEIRLSNYNAKSSAINLEVLKTLKLTRAGSFRRSHSQPQLRELKIFFGKAFNLQCCHFVVSGIDKVNNEHQNGSQTEENLKTWVARILNFLIREDKHVSYFEKLNRWFINEYAATELAIVSQQQRREIWHQFLERNHHGLSIEIIQENLRFLDSMLREHLEFTENKRFEINEFLLVAKYFVHNNESMTRILEDFKSSLIGYNNKDLAETSNILQSYFSYILKHKHELMLVSYDNIEILPNQRTLTIKDVVGKTNAPQLASQIVDEKWFSSYYILDYLYSSHNSIWAPEKLEIYQDMTQPLSHYFIASSHNTYLTGNQLNSKSSCEAYARVLCQGCRCIEIDVWDGPGNSPIVKHGNTMTTSIKLKDVLNTIKEHAFRSSKYPVIISIENHCNVQQQKTMAKYIKKTFGEMLCKIDELNGITGLPSPEQLKNRIILKGASIPIPERTNSSKDNIRSERQSPKLRSKYTKNRKNGHNYTYNDTSFIEPNTSEYLLVGELYVKKEDLCWEPQIFLLSSKNMICIEEKHCKSKTKRSQVPLFPVPRSMSLIDLLRTFHENEVWFHGSVQGEVNEVNERLRKSSVAGSFLVWDSTKIRGNFVLSIYYQTGDVPDWYKDKCTDVHHIPIQRRSLNPAKQKFVLGAYSFLTFTTIYDLVNYYLKNPVLTETFSLKHLGPPVPASLQKTHEHMEWFYKDIDQFKTENVLSKLFINGLFLGRNKDETCSELVISFRYKNEVKHCCIKRQGCLLTVANVQFRTLEGLVEYYRKNKFYGDVKLLHPLSKLLYETAISNEVVEQSLDMSPEYIDSNTKMETMKASSEPLENTSRNPSADATDQINKKFKAIREKDSSKTLKQFQTSFAGQLDELDCPFPGYIGLYKWKFGMKVTVKRCTNKNVLKDGITHYIVFEDENRSKRKLGTMCPIVAKEWAEMIDVVLENKQGTEMKHYHTKSSEDHKVAKELSDIVMLPKMKVNITPENFTKLLDDLKNNSDATNKCETFVKSFSELIAESSFAAYSTLWPLYHQHFLTRIYPKALRWNSSNFNPVPFWNFGSQLVSLNYQTPDKGMQINRGHFKQNGNIGYVLKPQCLLVEPSPQEEFLYDPTDDELSQVKSKSVLTIEIIGARHLEKSTPGQITPVVEVEIFGVDADSSKVKTSRQETGLNPCWNESFDFHLHYSELALIQFRVYDEESFKDRLFLGESTIPVSCIRDGYRCVELSNEYGYQLLSRLLIKLEIK